MGQYDIKYEEVKPLYVRLEKQIKATLLDLIVDKDISLFNVESRVKGLESFNEKVKTGSYRDPFNQIEDICGVRVICYYNSDMDFIQEVIEKEFDVHSGSDKQKEAEDNEFGYASRHFVVTLKKEWLKVPAFRGLDGLKVEIQLRTMLMHSWAAISHKLLYKKESDVPKKLKRSLNRLSALIELADEQFESLKIQKEEYTTNMDVVINDNMDDAINNEPLNSDNIISLVNTFSPGRDYTFDEIPDFLEEVKEYSFTLADLKKIIISAKEYLNIQEEQVSKHYNDNLPIWSVTGYLRAALELVSDEYFYNRWGADGESDFDKTVTLMRLNRQKFKMSTK
ncbi:hypothetical protein RIN65_04655 [Pantoea agglomerans]|uniref:GTP pyrophosphokinase n=1 Tax=Enterobacter agglomerans TaxID=549 RepID=UPI0028C48E9F|nr:hypothetical protein [Pantoea agglomerans]WNN35442.1 hypothetical protein RIN65_04655 [Pantoea agglomerans]